MPRRSVATQFISRFPRAWARIGGPLFTAALSLVIEFLADTPFFVPNPPAFLVLAIVFSAFIGGIRSGLASAVIAWVYVAWFFSQPGQPFQYGEEDLHRVVVWAFTMPLTAFMVGLLNRRAAQALAKAEIASLQQARVEGQMRLSIQNSVTLALSEANTLAEAMPKILQAVCQGLDWKRGECWSAHWDVDKGAMRLRCMEICQVPLNELGDFDAATRACEFAPGEGLPGRVWQRGKPEWTPDIAKDGFARLAPALKSGLHSAFAFPVKVGNEVLGVMVFLDGGVRPLDENQLQLMDAIGSQIGQFVERKRAVDALRDSGKRFRALIENSADAIALLDAQGRMLRFHSSAAGQILGYGMEENEGRRLFELVHPDDRERIEGEFARIIADPASSGTSELRARHKDGTWRWIEAAAMNLLGEPAVEAIVVNYRDVSARKRAETALQDSEGHFRTLIENSQDGIAVVDASGIVKYRSPSVGRILGYSEEDFREQNIIEAFHPDDLNSSQERFARLLQTPGETMRAEIRFRHRDGRWLWLESSGTNFLHDPSIGGIVANFRDITERRRAQVASGLMQATALSIAEAPDFDSALDNALRTLCEATGWKYAEAWIPRPDKSALELGPVWYGAGKQVERFRRASQEFIFHPGEGLPGRVWANKALEWIPDISVNREVFLRAPQALEAGLRAGMGVPIIGDGEVLVVAFFMFEARPEERAMMETATAIGNQLGTMLLRKRAEEENWRKAEKLQLIQALNNAANRGESIERIFELLKDGAAKIFSSRGTAFYRVSEDGSRLEISVLNLPPDLVGNIEKLIGMKLPKLEVSLREGGLYREILKEGRPRLINDPQSIQRLMAEFTDNPALKKMVGAIHSLLGDHSVMSVPLVSEGEPVGLLEVSRKEPFIEADLNRLALIGGEVTAILNRKRAEENLLVSEEKFRTLAETLPIGVAVTTPKGEIIEANPALVKMSGYDSKEEFLQDSAVIHYRDPQDRSRYVAQLLERGAIAGYELQLVRKDGSDFWASASSVTQRHPDGSITLVHSVEDISARKRREIEMETLLTIGQIVTQASELDALLQNLLDSVVNVLPSAEMGSILLAGEDGNLDIRAISGYGDARILGSSFPPTSGYSARAFRLGEALIVPDARAEAEIRYEGKIEEMLAVKSAMAAPLVAQGQPIGVIAVDNASRVDAFTEEDLRLLATISSSVALASQRARLLEETRQRLERIQALHEIDMTIASNVNLQHILETVLTQAIAQLGVDAASVLLLQPHSLLLEYAAGRGFRTRAIETSRIPLGASFAGIAALERRPVQALDFETARENPAFADLWQKEGLAAYYAVPLSVRGQVTGVLEVFCRASISPMVDKKEWMGFLQALAVQAALAVDNNRLFEGMQRSNVDLSLAYDATIEGWSRAMDLRDKETEGHTQRVANLTMKLARVIGVRDAEIIHIRRGALLHDIGKMGVPDGILLKPDKLTEEEWALMRKHPQSAYDMLAPISYLRHALDIPWCHHEKWDGTGYPRGLKGEQIPLAARLFALADVYDALTSDRPYRKGWSKEQVLDYIEKQSGAHFDPNLVGLFLSVVESSEEPEP